MYFHPKEWNNREKEAALPKDQEEFGAPLVQQNVKNLKQALQALGKWYDSMHCKQYIPESSKGC